MKPNSTTVLIPTYNRGNIITSVLKSVARQTLPPHEIIVVDDGSTDNTQERVLKFSENCAVPIRYEKQKNAGKCSALNNGMERCRSEFIAFNDSDDEWLPNKLELQIKALQSYSECGACFTNATYSNNGEVIGKPLLSSRDDLSTKSISVWRNSHSKLANNPYGIFMQTLLVRKEIAKKVFPLNPDYRIAQDIDLVYRLSLHTDYVYIKDVLVHIDRSVETGSRLTKDHDMKSIYRLKMLETITLGWITEEGERTIEVLPQLKKRLAQYQQSLANRLLEQGNREEAKQYAKLALKNANSVIAKLRYFKFQSRLYKKVP